MSSAIGCFASNEALPEAAVASYHWRPHYNTVWLHSSLGNLPLTSEAAAPPKPPLASLRAICGQSGTGGSSSLTCNSDR